MTDTRPTIVVIGGGFSGTAVALNLLRRRMPVRVVLVNRYGPMGRGVAYGTRIEAHVLNVPAGGMSALAEDPEHFLRWARARDASVGEGSFVSRRLYGEYLENLLTEAEREAPPASRLERVVGVANDLELTADGSRAEVRFDDLPPIDADRVVLALGNYSPNDPPVGEAFYRTDRYVRDPWIRGSLDVIRPDETVLMIGTGLTMMDIALDLAGRGVGLPLQAVSRRGLLPQPHAGPDRATALPPPPELERPPHRISQYVRLVRASAAAHTCAGGDWRDVVGSLRPMTPTLWERLDLAERARFLRHVRAYWEIHRHRAAPATAEAVQTMLDGGTLRVRAARILEYRSLDDGVEVAVRRRRTGEIERIRADRVVNCTGPSSDVRRVGDPLLDALLARGLIRPDPLRLGVETAEDLALLDSEGRPSRALYLVGPLLKAQFWEATAVPELRSHAARLAQRLLP